MTTHLPPDARKKQLLDVARAQAEKSGYASLTRDGITGAAGVASGQLNRLFGTLDGLRTELMKQAVRDGHLRIVAQGIIGGHPIARRASRDLRARALADYCK